MLLKQDIARIYICVMIICILKVIMIDWSLVPNLYGIDSEGYYAKVKIWSVSYYMNL